MLLSELSHSVTKLNGVGPAVAADLQQMGVASVRDLLLLLPRDYENRKTVSPLLPGSGDVVWVNTTAEVVAHDYFPFQGKPTLKIYIRDSEGLGSLVCFGRNFLARKLPVGSSIRICGHFAIRYGEFQCSAFDTEPASRPPHRFGRILPIYPLAGNLQQGRMRSIQEHALEQYGHNIGPSLPEAQVQPTARSLQQVHAPTDLGEAATGREALAYEELFFLQARIAQAVMQRGRHTRSLPHRPDTLLRQLLQSLPFELTPDQQSAIEILLGDLRGTVPMRRLLHGDVGSGKTLAAVSSALPVIEAGGQAVLLVPTELLAQQHARIISTLLDPLGIRVELLTGTLSATQRSQVSDRIRSGTAGLICATHAAFSRDIEYADLQYIIVDEQHRFGVEQRQSLIRKAEKLPAAAGAAAPDTVAPDTAATVLSPHSPDVLFMTATPIPRTLALTVFGDLEVSAIRTMPPGRIPVKTHLARIGNESKVYEWVRAELCAGRQAYFVYPLIRESSTLGIRDAETMAQQLAESVFPEFRLGLIHSETPIEHKARTMQDFARGDIQILAATSVVEVGVDVPNASCMVIEHAERFGLAALHQLRGRVGRGSQQSYCFLVYAEPLTEDAKQRIMVMKEHSDGFDIAEKDLHIRGPGDLTGTRQAGFIRLRAAALPRDTELMNRARRDAFTIIESDPGLEQTGHLSVRSSLQALHTTEMEGV